MWIMIIKHLPLANPPPRFSIFWSTSWPELDLAKYQKERYYPDDQWALLDFERQISTEEYFYDHMDFGKEPNALLARKIHFENEEIRVWKHEFSEITSKKMDFYIGEQDSIFTLVPESIASEKVMEFVLNKEYMPVYDAALLDGCNPNQAQLVALGEDITIPDAKYSPLGWYKPNLEYIERYFG